MMELVDTHCHIQSIGASRGERVTRQIWSKVEGLNADDVVKEAAGQGVTLMICVGCDLEDSRQAIAFAMAQDNCRASAGIHPHEAKLYAGKQAELDDFAKLAGKPKVVAIGECGLDYYYEHSPKAAQFKVLEYQMNLAAENGLPLIFHVREAFDDFWPVFDNFKGIKGVLHSYTDSSQNLSKAVDRGLCIGVNGIATFAKNTGQLEVYKSIPLDKLLLETDAPFLTPVPYRGTINVPKRLGAVADFLAELRGESRSELAKATTANARQLFGI
jgi:TatD DNase family protein